MDGSSRDALASLTAEEELQFQQAFIEDPKTGRIRFTTKGFAEYGQRFAKAGIDINQVRTRDAFRTASIKSECVVWEEIRELVKGHKELEEVLKPLWS